MDAEEINKEMPVAVLLQEHRAALLPMSASIDDYERQVDAMRAEVYENGAMVQLIINSVEGDDAKLTMAQHVTSINNLFRTFYEFVHVVRRHQRNVDELVARVALKYIARGGGTAEADALMAGAPTVAVAMDNSEVMGLTSGGLPRVIKETDDDVVAMDEYDT